MGPESKHPAALSHFISRLSPVTQRPSLPSCYLPCPSSLIHLVQTPPGSEQYTDVYVSLSGRQSQELNIINMGFRTFIPLALTPFFFNHFCDIPFLTTPPPNLVLPPTSPLDRISGSLSWLWTCYIAKDDFEDKLLILITPPTMILSLCWIEN
jgi:hypothetical protein